MASSSNLLNKTHLVIIDSQVADYPQIQKAIIKDAKIFILDSATDGIKQISKILNNNQNISTVHFISHGSPGCLYLGNSRLNLENLETYTPQLQTWFFPKSPSLLLYGCQVAAGDAGEKFITKLRRLTGLNIAASANLTGNAEKGGDWNLEVNPQQISTSTIFTQEFLNNYAEVFAKFKLNQETGIDNPFDGVDVGDNSVPKFVDLDEDGDFDAIVGENSGIINYYQNQGDSNNPIFTRLTGVDNPFDGVDVGLRSNASFADLDNDGDFDAFLGEDGGIVNFYRNEGNSNNPIFTRFTGVDNPFDGVDVGYRSNLSFADLDNDGDLDAVIGETDGIINYYENQGNKDNPLFTRLTGTANPFDGRDVGSRSAPSFYDLDNDGDFDLLVGDDAGIINYYENQGDRNNPNFAFIAHSESPFGGFDIGSNSTPGIVDIDRDGILDLFVGENAGNINYFKNLDSVTKYIQKTGTENLFDGVDIGSNSSPRFVDLDGDGDKDAFIGELDGIVNYYQNIGDITNPNFIRITGTDNPFDNISVQNNSNLSFVDLDNDGDQDVVIGKGATGTSPINIDYYKNIGNSSNPIFLQQISADNPFDGFLIETRSVPSFVDLDGDGDFDFVVGQGEGAVYYYQNIGNSNSPNYTQLTGSANPFNGIDVGRLTSLSFADLDQDGDFDAFLGEQDGIINYYQNVGDQNNPSFTQITGLTNPFDGIDIGDQSNITFADIDNDGNLEAFVGENTGNINYFEKTIERSLIITSSSTVNLDENIAEVITISANGEFLTYSITGGNDSSLFTIDSATGILSFNNAPDYENPIDSDGNNQYEVEITVTDGENTATQNLLVVIDDEINQSPTIEFPDTVLTSISFVETSSENPFNGVDIGSFAKPSFADLDGDGDTDAFVGTWTDGVYYYKNESTADNLSFTQITGNENPFLNASFGWNTAPSFADLDEDGDLDAIVGDRDGNVVYYQNQSTIANLSFVEILGNDNPFSNINVGEYAAPSFADLDEDGDLDAFIGDKDGKISYYKNESTAGSFSFIEITGNENPFDAINVGLYASPSFADLDEDGDLDLFIGELNKGIIFSYENQSTPGNISFIQMTGDDNPFSYLQGGVGRGYASPSFADLDEDGDLDLFVGRNNGQIFYHKNTVEYILHIDDNTTEVITVTATDPDPEDTLTYSINGGNDSNLFSINSATGVVSFKTTPDFDNPTDSNGDNNYEIAIAVSDGEDITTQNLVITVHSANESPTITSSNIVSIHENITEVITVTATDPDPEDTLTYSISGGNDSNLFTINSTTGVLSFKTAPDYENPTDNNGDNNYEVAIAVSDGQDTTIQNLVVTVNNVNESPTVTSSNTPTIDENTTEVITITATDEDTGNNLTYSISSGNDSSLFTIDSATGVLSFKTAPDYENPTDSNGDNNYEVAIAVSDGNLTTTQNLIVTVNDVDDLLRITSNNTVSIDENTANVITLTANRESITYSISGGNDSSLFLIDSETGVVSFSSAPNYEAPTDSNGDNNYELEITVTDGVDSATQNLVVTVNDVNESPAITSSDRVSIEENTTEVITVTATDPDAGDNLTYSISGGSDRSLFSIDIATGVLSFKTAPDYENPSDRNGDNNYEVEITVTDGNLSNTQNIAIAVSNIIEPLVITSSDTASINENVIEAITVTATGESISYSISGGDDSSLFNIDSATGILSFKTAPDYENPTDSDSDNNYEVEVTVTDGITSQIQNIAIAVNNVNESSIPVVDIDDSENIIHRDPFNNSTVGITASYTNPDSNNITYSLLNNPGGAFGIDTDTGVITLAKPTALDYGNNNQYQITVQAFDGVSSSNNNFTVDIDTVAVLSSLISQDNLINLTNDFLSLVNSATINQVEDTENLLETLEVSIDSLINITSELDLANTLGITDTSAAEYELLAAIVDVIDGTEVNVVDTTLDINGLTYIREYIEDNPNTTNIDETDTTLDLIFDIDGNILTYSKNSTKTKINYDGNIDGLSLVNVLLGQTDLTGIPSFLSFTADGFAVELTDNTITKINLLYDDDVIIDLSNIFSLGGGIPLVDDIINEIITSFLGTDKLTFSDTKLGISQTSSTAILSLDSLLNGRKISIDYLKDNNFSSSPDNILFEYELGAVDFANIAAGTPILEDFKLEDVSLFIAKDEYNNFIDEDLGTITLTEGLNLLGQIDFSDDNSGFSKFINDKLGINYLLVKTALNNSGISLEGTVKTDINLISSGDFSLVLNGFGLGFGLDATLEPSLEINSTLSLSGYDPFQSNEPTLALIGGLKLEPESLTAFFALKPGESWDNPFGLPNVEIRNLGVQFGGTYLPPFIDNLGLIADLQWGELDLNLGLGIDVNDPENLALALTLYQPVSLIDLWTVQATPLLSPFLSEIDIVNDAIELLEFLVPIEVVSFDSNDDGKLDPLVQFVPVETEIAGTTLSAGFAINAEISVFGAKGFLDLTSNDSYTAFQGGLEIPEIKFDINGFNIITLGGYNPNGDNTEQTLDDPNLDNNSLDLEFKVSPTETYLRGDGRLEILGTAVANAAFSIGLDEINIQDFDINLFEVITLDIDNFYLNFRTFNGGGAAALTFFGQTLTDVSFTINNGTYYQLNINQLGFGDLLAFQDVNLTLDFQQPLAAAEGSLVFLGQDIASASVEISPDGLLIEDVNVDLAVAKLDIPEVSITGLSEGNPAFKAQSSFEIIGIPLANIDIEYGDGVFNAQDVSFGVANIAEIAIPELYIDFNNGEFDAEGELNVLGANLASVDAEYQDDTFSVDAFWGIDMKLPVVGKVKIGVDIGISSTDTSSSYSFGFVFWGVRYGIDIDINGNIEDAIKDILDPILDVFGAIGEAIGAVFNAIGDGFKAVGKFFKSIFGGSDKIVDKYVDAQDKLDDYNNPILTEIEALDSAIALAESNGESSDVIEQLQSQRTNLVKTLRTEEYAWKLKGGKGNDTVLGLEGNDTITGSSRKDLLHGFGGDDSINGGTGDDTIYGGDGNDTLDGGKKVREDEIYGEAGADLIAGGDGNDTLDGGSENDTIDGGEGSDLISGGSGDDVISGGKGNDTIEGNEGNDIISGDDGNDLIYGGAGNDTLDGGAGDDSIYGEDGNDVISAGKGDDVIYAGAGNDFVIAGEGNDLISGDDTDGIGYADTLDGGAGNDTIYGYGGDDIIYGGSGQDSLEGGAGNDFIYGNDGLDYIDGEDGDDQIEGGAGNDTLIGGEGHDSLNGGEGDDTIEGNEGDDYLAGGIGIDTLIAGAGNDIVEGGSGSDYLEGNEGNDYLFGESNAGEATEEDTAPSNDTLLGGAGNDTLIGGEGDDLLIDSGGVNSFDGGAGKDILDLSGATDNLKLDFNRNLSLASNDTSTVGRIANVEVIITGSGNDIIVANSDNNDINTGAGNDLIDVREGLEVTTGNDTIVGGSGSDTLVLADTTEDYDYSQLGDILLFTDSNNQVKTVSGIETFFFDDGNLTLDAFKARPDINDLLSGNFNSLEEFLSIVRVLVNDGLYNLLPDLTLNLNQIEGFNLGFQKQAENVDLAIGIGQLANEEFGIQDSTSSLAEILNIENATTLTEIFDRLTNDEIGLGLDGLLGLNNSPLIFETLRNVLGIIDSTGIADPLIDGLNEGGDETSITSTSNSPFKGVGFSLDSILDNPDTILNESEENITFTLGINDTRLNIGRGVSGDNSYSNYNFSFDGKVDILGLIAGLINSTNLVTIPPEVSLEVEDFNISFTEEFGTNAAQILNLTIGSLSNTEEGLDLAAMFGITNPDSFMYDIIGGVVDSIDGTEIGVVDTVLNLQNISFEMNRRFDILSLQNASDTDYTLNLDINGNNFSWQQNPNSYQISYDGTVDPLAIVRGLVNTTDLFNIPQDVALNVAGFDINYALEENLLSSHTPSFLEDTAEKEIIETFNFSIGAVSNGESGLDLAKLFGLSDTNSFGHQLVAGFVDTINGSEVGVIDTTLEIDGLDFTMQEIATVNTENDTIRNIVNLNVGINGNDFIWNQDGNSWGVSYNGTVDLFALTKGLINGSGLATIPETTALNINGFDVSYTELELQNSFELSIGSVNDGAELDIAQLFGLTDTESIGYQLVEGFIDTLDGSDEENNTSISFHGLDLIINNYYDNPETLDLNEASKDIAFNLGINENNLLWNQDSNGWRISYDGTTDVLALVRALANSSGIFNLPETFSFNVDTFDISFTEIDSIETLNISLGEASEAESEEIGEAESEGVDLAQLFGISDTNSFDYRLITALANTVSGTEEGVDETITKPIINLEETNFVLENDLETGDRSLSLNLNTGENEFIWRQSSDNFEISYDGTVDLFSLLRFAANETNLVTLPDDFILNVDGFSIKSFEDGASKTLDIQIGSISNTAEGLDLAAMFGISDPNSFGYQLIGGIVDTIDGSEIGIIDTILEINGFSYNSTEDLINNTQEIAFSLDIGNNQFIWNQDNNGYNISYDGTVDVLAILRTLGNGIDGFNLPDEFALNVDGFALDYTETTTTEKFDFNLGQVSNTQEGLDLAAMFGISDPNSFGYQLIGGIVDTIDGSEVGVIDTVLGFNGLDLAIENNIETDETNLDLELAIDNNLFTYSQKSNNKYQFSYDGTIDVLALVKVLIDQTGLITATDEFALNIDGFAVDITTNDQQEITDYRLDINQISQETIVGLFNSLGLPQFVDRFINAIAGDIQLIFTDNSFQLNYQDTLEIDAILESIAAGLGLNIDLAPLSIINPSLTVAKVAGQTNYELLISHIDPGEFITFFVESIGLNVSQNLQNQLSGNGNASLLLSNSGMILTYQDDIIFDLGEVLSFGGSIQAIEDIVDNIVTLLFGDDILTLGNSQFSISGESNNSTISLSSFLNNKKVALTYAESNTTLNYEVGDLDFGVLGLDILDGIKLGQTEFIVATEAEKINYESIGEVDLVNGVNLLGQIDFSQSNGVVGQFINDYLGIESLAGYVRVSPDSGLSLAAKLIAEIPLIDIGNFQLIFNELGLGLDADFANNNYAFTIESILTLAGYDPFQNNEPDLLLNGGLSLDALGTLTGFFSLNPEETWTNIFGIPDTEIRRLAIELGMSVLPVPRPDNFGFIADFRWGTIDVDLAMAIDITDPTDIAATFTLNQPVGLTDLFLGPVSPFIGGINSQVLDGAISLIDKVVDVQVVSADSDGDGELDPLVEFVPFPTEIAGIQLEQGIGINAQLFGFGASATLILGSDATYTNFVGSLTIPEINIAIGNVPLLTLSGASDDTLNLEFKAGLDEIYLKGDGRLEIFGQEVAKTDFSISPTRIDIKELDLNLFGLITLDIDDLFLDFETFDGGGAVDLSILGRTIADASFSIDNGTKYSLNIEQLGFGRLLALQDVNLSLDFEQFDAAGAASVVLLGKEILETSFSIGSDGLDLSSYFDINIPLLGSASLDFDLGIGLDRSSVRGDFDLSLLGFNVDLGFIKKRIRGFDFGITPMLEIGSGGLRGGLEDIEFSVFGKQIASFDLTFSTGNSIDGWDDVFDDVSDSAKRKALSAVKSIFTRPFKTIGRKFKKLFNGYIDGAEVWLDLDGDGVLDSDEPKGITKVDGSFVLEIADDFDLSGKVIRSMGGIDTATGLPVVGVMSAPANGNITPLTSLIQELIEGGATETEAIESIRTGLGISANVDLLNFNHIDEALNGNPEARNVLLGVNTLQGIVTGVLNLLAGSVGSTIDNLEPAVNIILSNAAYGTLAELIKSNSFNLEDATQIETVIRNAATAAETQAQQQGVTLDLDNTLIDNIANQSAQVLAAGVSKKRLLSEESADGIDLFTIITQAKFIANGQEAIALNDFALGNISESDILALADTSETALQAIRDVNLKPQLADISDLYLTDGQDIIGLPITLFDFETPYEQLNITFTSNNPTLLPTENISIAADTSPTEALLTISPLDGEIGEATINITVEDGDGNSISESILVTVETDLAPVFSQVPNTIVLTGRNSELGSIVTNLDADDGNGGDVDLSVSYSIVPGNNLDGDDLEPFAIGMDGEVVMTDPDDLALADPLNPFNLTIEANDGKNITQTTLAIKVNDAPTVANPIADRSIRVGQPFNFQFASDRFEDLNQDNLIYTATLADGQDLPSWLSFDPNSRTFSSNTNPTIEEIDILKIKITASDEQYSVSDSFNLAVVNTIVDDSKEQQGTNDDDAVAGGDGQDTVRGGNGDDVIGGNNGADRLFGDRGRDYLVGGEGNDKLNGGEGNDKLNGGEGNDKLSGGEGNDTLLGEGGKDRLSGDAGDDFLNGGTENDYLKGGEGNDILYGGGGSDKLRGSEDNDIFVLTYGDMDNIIIDYLDSEDKLGLELASFSGNTVEDIFNNELTIVANNSDAEIYANSGNDLLAILSNIDVDTITVEDFIEF